MEGDAGMSEYVDARKIHPEYDTVPCRECDAEIIVPNRFSYNHDDWYCRACKPERLKNLVSHHVEVPNL